MPPCSVTAGDSPIATSGTSTVSSSVIRTRNRSTWSVPAVDRVDLDRRDEHRTRLAAVDRQVDQGVRAGVPAELLELVRVDRHAGGVDAVAVDDGGQLAGVAEAGDLLAGDVAMFGGERRAGGGHDGGTSGSDGRRGFGLRLAGGAGVARRPGSAR